MYMFGFKLSKIIGGGRGFLIRRSVHVYSNGGIPDASCQKIR